MEDKLELAIVDFKHLLDEFDKFTHYKLVVPKYYITDLYALIEHGKKNVSVYKVNQVLEYLEQNAIIIEACKLPHINVSIHELQANTYLFARYVLYIQKMYPNIRVITNSFKTKRLLKLLRIEFFKK